MESELFTTAPAKHPTEADLRWLVLIPAHNEADNLQEVVGELRTVCPAADILIVDDGSEDDSVDLLPRLGVEWLSLNSRLGVGGAVRVGLQYALHLGYDWVVRLDGDGQHRADEIQSLTAPLARGDCDVVLGSRYLGAAGFQRQGVRRIGQQLLASALSALTRQRLTDPTSGAWAFGPRAVRVLSRHHPTGYGEPELLLFLHRNRFRLQEVPIEMRQRVKGRSSLTPSRELMALARVMLAMTVVPLRQRVEDVSDA